jgi:hypothetical protein
VSGVAIQHRGVAVRDLTRVVEDDDLSEEVLGGKGGLVLGVGGDVTTTDVLDRDVLDVEADVVTGDGLGESFVVHLDGLDFGGQVNGGKGDDHAGLEDTSFDSTDWHRSDTADFVDVLKGKSEGLVGRTSGRHDGIESLEEGGSAGLAFLAGDFPALVPSHVGGRREHVVSVPSGDGDKGDGGGVVTDLLDVVGDFLLDFLETALVVWRLGGVHLVDSDDELLDAQGVGEESVLAGLTVLGDAGFELTGTSSDDQDAAVSLRGSSDHVLNEISVAGSVNDGDVELRSLELPEGDVDGDTTLALGLQLVQNPSVLEGALAHLEKEEKNLRSVSLRSARIATPLPISRFISGAVHDHVYGNFQEFLLATPLFDFKSYYNVLLAFCSC